MLRFSVNTKRALKNSTATVITTFNAQINKIGKESQKVSIIRTKYRQNDLYNLKTLRPN